MSRVASLFLSLLAIVSTAVAGERRYPFEQRELPNGLKVITLEDASCPIVAVQVWYHVGAKNEDPGRQGFAHMFEHMMFRGTDRLNETAHFDNIRRVGGDTNAYTAFDQTVYIQKVPSDQLEMVLWLEAERMAFLKIDQKGFDTERKVVEEELRLGHNRPYGRVPENLLAEVYGDKPYAWTPGGQIKHLRAASIDELQAFWDKYYVPNNATLVIVGDIKHADAHSLAKKYFEWIPRCADPPRPIVPPIDQKKPRTIRLKEEKGPLPVMGVLYRAVPQSHPDAIPLEMLMNILGGGESSRLYVDLVKDQKIAQVAIGAMIGFEADGLAGAAGVILPMGKKQQVMKSILAHIKRIVSEGVTDAELNKAKNQARRSEVTGALTVTNKARLLGAYAVLYGDADEINRRLDRIDAVDAAQIQRVAKKYLVDAHRMNVFIEPSLGGFLGSILSKDDAEAQEDKPAEKENRVARRTGPKAAAKRPADFPDKPPAAKQADEFPMVSHQDRVLDNGLPVVVVSNHEVPFVTMVLGIKSGAWSESAPGSASLAMQMLSQGTKSHSAKELAELLESNAISLSGLADMDSARVTVSALLPQLDLAAELMADVVMNPTFPKDELDILLKQTRMGLLVSTKTPEYLADRELRRRLYGSHPYARTVTGELEDLAAIKPDLLKAWWTANLRPDNAVLYVAGDIKPADAFKLAENHLGRWKTDGSMKTPTLPSMPPSEATHIYIVDRPGSVQSQIRVGHRSITRRDDGYFNAMVLGNILGGGFNSRLNKAIRVDKGLTYGARGGFTASRFGGELRLSTFTKTPHTAQTLRVLLDEIDKMRSGPPTTQELDDTRTYLVGSFPGDRETPEATVSDLWMINTQDLPRDYLRRMLAGVKSCSAEAVQGAADSLIHPDKLTIVVVGEAAKIKADLEKIAPVTVVSPPKATPEDEKPDEHATH